MENILTKESNKGLKCPACAFSQDIRCIGKLPSKLNPKYTAIMHKCMNCKTIFTWPIISENEMKEFYSQVFTIGLGKTISEHIKSKANMAQGLLRKVSKWLPISGDILDIGTGFGEWLQLLHKKGLYDNYFGIEYSEVMVKETLKRAPFSNVYKSSAENIRDIYGNRKFRLITIIAAIEHLRFPEKAIKYISDSLENEGRTVIVYPRVDSFLSRLLRKKWHLFSPVAHLTLYSKKGLIESLNNHGLKVVTSQHMRQSWDLQYVISTAVYFYPLFKSLLNLIKKINIIQNIQFSLYTGVDIVVAKKIGQYKGYPHYNKFFKA